MTDIEDDCREWPTLGRKLLQLRLSSHQRDLEEALGKVVDDLFDGQDPDPEDIRAARQALDNTRNAVEMFAAAAADDVEPWGDGMNKHAPEWVRRREAKR